MIPPYIRAAQRGDESAWATLHERHYRYVVSVAARIVGAENADDVAQDVFTRLVRCLGQFRGDSAFQTWLHRIVVNVSLMALRRRRSRIPTESLDALVGESGEYLAALAEEDGALRGAANKAAMVTAFAQLSPNHREILLLRDVWGYSVEEVCGILGVGESAVKSRTRQARLRAKKILQTTRRTQ